MWTDQSQAAKGEGRRANASVDVGFGAGRGADNAMTRARTAPSRRGYLLTLGFGTTVAMWTIGYISRIPPVWVPNWLLLVLLVCCLLAGGYLAGRLSRVGMKAGVAVGALSSVLNLLILGGLLSGDQPNQVAASAIWWVPGSILLGALLGGIGGAAGAATPRHAAGSVESATELNWTTGFALVAAAATFILVVAGGLVTSHRAGLAVVDWPNSFGYSMFLYPLSRMTGGIYYEHAHRLLGSLVGLTTLVLAVHLWLSDRRRWVRYFALGAFALVVLQGILGGLRVTGGFTLSTSPEVMRPSLLLAMVHAVTGQIFFGMLIALAAFTSTTWLSSRPATPTAGAPTDRGLSLAVIGVLMLQLVLGAILRHADRGLMVHIMMAIIVTVLVVAAGVRAAGLDRGQPILARVGGALLIILGAQVVLGIGALVVTGLARSIPEIPVWKVAITTSHQVTGALLLAVAVLTAAWNHRLLEAPAPE